MEASIIYHVADSQWVSHVHCVPKKGGITVVPNDKLNKPTRKHHYPLPFIDQML